MMKALQRAICLIGLAWIGATSSWAQIDAQTLRYYPLHIGDEWHYEVASIYGGMAMTVQVLKDTTLTSRVTYRKKRVLSYSSNWHDPHVGYEYERIDSMTGIVYRYVGSGKEEPLHHLALPPDSLFKIDTADIYFTAQCDSVPARIILDQTRNIKTCWMRRGSTEEGYWYAEDVGVSSFRIRFYEGLPSVYTLVFARINGQELGTPLPTSVDESPRPAPALAVAVYPNPAANAFVVSFTLAGPQIVRMEMFDLLGRRVWADQVRYDAAGSYRKAVEVPNLAEGLYWLRLDGGREHALVSVVVRQ